MHAFWGIALFFFNFGFGQGASVPEEAGARETPMRPICSHPSHDRLIEQRGRDVCAASLDAAGRPRAEGRMPTACPLPGQVLHTDETGITDTCRLPQTTRGQSGKKP